MAWFFWFNRDISAEKSVRDGRTAWETHDHASSQKYEMFRQLKLTKEKMNGKSGEITDHWGMNLESLAWPDCG